MPCFAGVSGVMVGSKFFNVLRVYEIWALSCSYEYPHK